MSLFRGWYGERKLSCCLPNTSTLESDGLYFVLPIMRCAFGAHLDVGFAERPTPCRFIGTVQVSFPRFREGGRLLIKRNLVRSQHHVQRQQLSEVTMWHDRFTPLKIPISNTDVGSSSAKVKTQSFIFVTWFIGIIFLEIIAKVKMKLFYHHGFLRRTHLTFITWNSSIEPMLEGLFAQIHIDVSWHVFGRNWTGDLRITQFVESRALLHCAMVTDASSKILQDFPLHSYLFVCKWVVFVFKITCIAKVKSPSTAIHVAHASHLYMRHDSFKFIRATWIHMCDVTHSYVCHDSFSPSSRRQWRTWSHPPLLHTWHMHHASVCNMTYSIPYVQTWLIHECVATQFFLLCGTWLSFMNVTWLIHTCETTHLYFATWLIHMCDMIPLYVWHDFFTYVTMLRIILHIVWMALSHVQYASLIVATWFVHV